MSDEKRADITSLAREGGLARARNLTPEERRLSAKKAAQARWNRYRAEQESIVAECATPERTIDVEFESSHVEINAYEDLWQRSLKHRIGPNCPCDECVDSVMADVRRRYTDSLRRIDSGHALDKQEKALFRTLVGEKVNRWTSVYRSVRKSMSDGLYVPRMLSDSHSDPLLSRKGTCATQHTETIKHFDAGTDLTTADLLKDLMAETLRGNRLRSDPKREIAIAKVMFYWGEYRGAVLVAWNAVESYLREILEEHSHMSSSEQPNLNNRQTVPSPVEALSEPLLGKIQELRRLRNRHQRSKGVGPKQAASFLSAIGDVIEAMTGST